MGYKLSSGDMTRGGRLEKTQGIFPAKTQELQDVLLNTCRVVIEKRKQTPTCPSKTNKLVELPWKVALQKQYPLVI